MHKEAQRRGEEGFNRQAKRLLGWTSEIVVPAMLGAQSSETELRDLDLSHISNVSDSTIMRASLSTLSNLRKSPNKVVNRTSALLDQTFDDPPVFLVSSLARSLLQLSCVVFAEHLAVGGSCLDEVEKSAVGWCQVFDDKYCDTEDNRSLVKRELLPGFLRLATQLCRYGMRFDLLRKIFVQCSEASMGDDIVMVRKAVAALLAATSRGGSKLTERVIDNFLLTVDELIEEDDRPLPGHSIRNANDVWSHPKGCLSTVLEAIVSNENASLLLARNLVVRLASSEVESGARQCYETRCLSLLIKVTKSSSTMATIVTDLETDRFKDDAEICGVVHHLLESVG